MGERKKASVSLTIVSLGGTITEKGGRKRMMKQEPHRETGRNSSVFSSKNPLTTNKGKEKL